MFTIIFIYIQKAFESKVTTRIEKKTGGVGIAPKEAYGWGTMVLYTGFVATRIVVVVICCVEEFNCDGAHHFTRKSDFDVMGGYSSLIVGGHAMAHIFLAMFRCLFMICSTHFAKG